MALEGNNIGEQDASWRELAAQERNSDQRVTSYSSEEFNPSKHEPTQRRQWHINDIDAVVRVPRNEKLWCDWNQNRSTLKFRASLPSIKWWLDSCHECRLLWAYSTYPCTQTTNLFTSEKIYTLGCYWRDLPYSAAKLPRQMVLLNCAEKLWNWPWDAFHPWKSHGLLVHKEWCNIWIHACKGITMRWRTTDYYEMTNNRLHKFDLNK